MDHAQGTVISVLRVLLLLVAEGAESGAEKYRDDTC